MKIQVKNIKIVKQAWHIIFRNMQSVINSLYQDISLVSLVRQIPFLILSPTPLPQV